MYPPSTMIRIPRDYLPDDANWTEARLPNEFLQTQCRRRRLSTDGNRKALEKRLSDYHEANNPIARNTDWLMTPYYFATQNINWYWRFRKHFITKVVDKSDPEGDLRKCFTVVVSDQEGTYRSERQVAKVTFDRNPACSCVGGTIAEKKNCSHYIYVIRDVLGCPEPLHWQRSFLPSEIDLIYRNSPAVRCQVDKDKYSRDDFCFLCFKQHIEEATWVQCTACEMPMDKNCYQNFKEARDPTAHKEGQCIVCVDKTHWGVEKYRKRYEEASAADIAPAEEALAADIAPAEEASAADIAPAEEASAADIAPVEEASAADITPAEEALTADIAPAEGRRPSLAESNAHSSIEVKEIPHFASPSRSISSTLGDLNDSGSNYSDAYEGLDSDDHGDEQSDNGIYAGEDAVSPPRLRRRPHTAETTLLAVPERINASTVPPTRPVNAHEMSTVRQRSTFTPLPGNPLLIWLDRQQQQQQQQKQKQKQVQALQPVIDSRRVSILPGPTQEQAEEEETDEPEASVAVVPPGPGSNPEHGPAFAPTLAQTPAPIPTPFPTSAFIPVQAYTAPPTPSPDAEHAHSPPAAVRDAALGPVKPDPESTREIKPEPEHPRGIKREPMDPAPIPVCYKFRRLENGKVEIDLTDD